MRKRKQEIAFTLQEKEYATTITENAEATWNKTQQARGTHIIYIENPDKDTHILGWSYYNKQTFGTFGNPTEDSVQAQIVNYVNDNLV